MKLPPGGRANDQGCHNPTFTLQNKTQCLFINKMARALHEEVCSPLKELIHQISGYEDGSDAFTQVEKGMKAEIKKGGTMYFLHRKEIDSLIQGMSDKYLFHGFARQAEALTMFYNKFLTGNLSRCDLMTRLNIIKFLVGISDNPIKKFATRPEDFLTEPIVKPAEIDWKAYLNEGIEWRPPCDEESTDFSDFCSSTDIDQSEDETAELTTTFKCDSTTTIISMDNPESIDVFNLKESREELLSKVQHSWFNENNCCMPPESTWRDANIAILWDKYLENEVKGLIPFERVSIISEYKVIREILWQMYALHQSSCFYLDGNTIKPKDNITIASVRCETFQTFLYEFIPYMEQLEFFREFQIELKNNITDIPLTYRSYGCSLERLISPIYEELSKLEDQVKAQDETFTLINLADKLENMFAPILAIRKIHNEVIVDFKSNTALHCSTTLLVLLHSGLQYTANKLEQDLRLTLFLECFYHYLTVIDCWLMKDDLSDNNREFLIFNESENEGCELNFKVQRNLSDLCKGSRLMRIITDQVFEIGKNICLLRLLGKYNLLSDYKETIHEEFINKTLAELAQFYKTDLELKHVNNNETDILETENVNLVEVVTSKFHFDRLEYCVNVDDGILMEAFSMYTDKLVEKVIEKKETLYERISRITKNLFPFENFFENILNEILKDRFTISGLMVKNILTEQYKLDKQFEFLRHAFLFSDDLIFPFYRRLFNMLSVNYTSWGNEVWLTSHLQDIFIDLYPDFSENCKVLVSEHWTTCSESLQACNLLNLDYSIQWPLNIIIQANQMKMYREIFLFILKLKWALHTVNHLQFYELEPKNPSKSKEKRSKAVISVAMKFKYLKFHLINLLNNIQHYVFGFVFYKCLKHFELEFEKANDLKSVMLAHENYIRSVHQMVLRVRDCHHGFKSGFESVLECVKLLQNLWDDISLAFRDDHLTRCYDLYETSFKILNHAIRPADYFE